MLKVAGFRFFLTAILLHNNILPACGHERSSHLSRFSSALFFFSFFFFFHLTYMIADGPHHYHPACGHKGSSHLSPVYALQFFIAMQVQHSYNSSTNG